MHDPRVGGLHRHETRQVLVHVGVPEELLALVRAQEGAHVEAERDHRQPDGLPEVREVVRGGQHHVVPAVDQFGPEHGSRLDVATGTHGQDGDAHDRCTSIPVDGGERPGGVPHPAPARRREVERAGARHVGTSWTPADRGRAPRRCGSRGQTSPGAPGDVSRPRPPHVRRRPAVHRCSPSTRRVRRPRQFPPGRAVRVCRVRHTGFPNGVSAVTTVPHRIPDVVVVAATAATT